MLINRRNRIGERIEVRDPEKLSELNLKKRTESWISSWVVLGDKDPFERASQTEAGLKQKHLERRTSSCDRPELRTKLILVGPMKQLISPMDRERESGRPVLQVVEVHRRSEGSASGSRTFVPDLRASRAEVHWFQSRGKFERLPNVCGRDAKKMLRRSEICAVDESPSTSNRCCDEIESC